MGLFRFFATRGQSKRQLDSALVHVRAAVEPLEQRVLFAVQVNTNVFDAVTPSSYPAGAFADQAETSNVSFSLPGNSNNQVAVAYNDGSMLRYAQVNGAPMHQTGWAYSSDGGQSFDQPSNDPANPALLPTVPNGAQTTGDQANHSLAWNNANATLYMANTSFPTESDINVYASTDGGQTFPSGVDATPGAPTTNGTTYDKPSLAVDNYPGTANGTGFGTLYLAYVQNLETNSGENQIVITSLAPGATSWPTPQNNGTPPGFVLATGLVQSPEVLVEPNHSVDVVYVAEVNGQLGIYLDHSANPTISQGWTTPPTEIAAY